MIVELTREQVARAILKAYICDTVFSLSGGVELDRCPACAAGSVFRRCLSSSVSVWDAREQFSKITKSGPLGWGAPAPLLRKRQWLNAISVAFETAVDDHLSAAGDYNYLKAIRAAAKDTADFARKNLPDVIRIDVGNLKPRKGTKVFPKGART